MSGKVDIVGVVGVACTRTITRPLAPAPAPTRAIHHRRAHHDADTTLLAHGHPRRFTDPSAAPKAVRKPLPVVLFGLLHDDNRLRLHHRASTAPLFGLLLLLRPRYLYHQHQHLHTGASFIHPDRDAGDLVRVQGALADVEGEAGIHGELRAKRDAQLGRGPACGGGRGAVQLQDDGAGRRCAPEYVKHGKRGGEGVPNELASVGMHGVQLRGRAGAGAAAPQLR
ncbi:hypothetical protein C8J57DRAFT_1246405 [Mycena rebaudengoi]|nr:hypothetical protein C8J57DRAFT_1246405 [Mycena rebaudengoi]